MQIEIVDIITPEQLKLRGIWAGAQNADTVYIFMHGLSSDAFAGKMIFDLAQRDHAILSFSNRGSDVVSRFKKLNPSVAKGYESVSGGMAHEIFEECIDDVEGAVQFAKSRGAKYIYLVGHSTGCQKTIFYLSKTKQSPVSGVVLLAPLSDYAAIPAMGNSELYAKALAFARSEVQAGRSTTLLPESIWPSELIDAQRFLSLYTPESSEEIFTYAHDKQPDTFQSVALPMLVLLAGTDEYADRPSEKIRDWFDKSHRSREYRSVVVPDASHNFKDCESTVCQVIQDWENSLSKK